MSTTSPGWTRFGGSAASAGGAPGVAGARAGFGAGAMLAGPWPEATESCLVSVSEGGVEVIVRERADPASRLLFDTVVSA